MLNIDPFQQRRNSAQCIIVQWPNRKRPESVHPKRDDWTFSTGEKATEYPIRILFSASGGDVNVIFITSDSGALFSPRFSKKKRVYCDTPRSSARPSVMSHLCF